MSTETLNTHTQGWQAVQKFITISNQKKILLMYRNLNMKERGTVSKQKEEITIETK